MNLRSTSITGAMLLGAFFLAGPAHAASPIPLSGEILGEVKSSAGVAQMGALVSLYNRYDELVHQGLTNEQGRFVFDSLVPGIYSIRVILASFAPAERRNIAVQAGSENLLNINLASVFSTISLGTPNSKSGTILTDDWKWVLRSSQSTRPVLRILPNDQVSTSSHTVANAFSNTTGVVKVSAGGGESFTLGGQEDLGTAFALATTLAGSSRVQVSGNLGYAGTSMLPGAGLRTSYSHPMAAGSAPEVVLTMHQFYLGPSRSGTGMTVGTDSAPALRTASLALIDKLELSDGLKLDYGFDFESVSYLDRLNYLSPFLRATYDVGTNSRVRAGFSSGAHPTELLARDEEASGSLDPDFAALAAMPRVSQANGAVRVERTQNAEIGYEHSSGSRTYSAAVYAESVTNAAFMLSGSGDFLNAGDIMPDLRSNSSIFNVGGYRRTGMTVAVTQQVGDHFELAAAAGRTGALSAPGDETSYGSGSDLRAGIHEVQRPWVTVRASGTVPKSGTHFTTDYGWMDFNTLMPAHVFLTLKTSQDIGWNVYIRQPLPYLFGMPWRMEATAELRNILAQGYLPLGTGANRTILTNSPRAVRGGLAFIF